MELDRFRLIASADDLSDKIWHEVQQWNRFNQDTIGKQLVRAVDSISANLSEAYGRFSFMDRKRLAYIARGSLCETLTWIGKAQRRGIIGAPSGIIYKKELEGISYQLNFYIRSLKSKLK